MKVYLDIKQDARDTPEEAIEKIRRHLREERNIIRDLVAFDTRKQRQGESFTSFLVALKKVAHEASLDDCNRSVMSVS